MIQQIALDLIFTRKDARKLDDAAVRGLVSSIGEVGIINPLRVRPVIRHVAGVETDAFEVTAGAHRLKAARKIGLETVPCIVADDDDLHAELAMIDENLMRTEMGTGDRNAAFARRRAIYLEIHPETEAGAIRAAAMNAALGNNVDAQCAPTFAEATSEALGVSKRFVQVAAELGDKIAPEVVDMVRGTEKDAKTYFVALKDMPPEQQIAKVRRDIENAEKRRSLEKKMANDSRIAQLSGAERFAQWILERSDLSELDVVIGWLNSVKAKDVITILTREAA